MTDLAEKFRRIHSIPAYQLVAEAIENRILAGGIRPGEPIGTEAELVKQFGVNRSTVREGIRLNAGYDTGRTVNDFCFTTDVPNQPRDEEGGALTAGPFCRWVVPFAGRAQFKVNGSVPLPGDFIE